MNISEAFVYGPGWTHRVTVGADRVKEIKVDTWDTGMHILEIRYDDGSIEEVYNMLFSTIRKTNNNPSSPKSTGTISPNKP